MSAKEAPCEEGRSSVRDHACHGHCESAVELENRKASE